MSLSRRSLLGRALALGCCSAASPLLTPVTFAAAPWDARLVVIILRGGMDGMGVVQPYGDPAFAALRGAPDVDGPKGPADLDGHFALHPALAGLHPLWQAGELGFAHAVATPYRDKRSHFDGQDLLEAGTAHLDGTRDGWLNRLLQVSGAHDPRTAFALGRENLIMMSGDAPYSSWTPEVDFTITPQVKALAEMVMSSDPVFGAALTQALELAAADTQAAAQDEDQDEAGAGAESGMESMGGMMGGQKATPKGKRPPGHEVLARYAGRQLSGAARIAAFSLPGWDTHQQQHRSLTPALTRLGEVILTLKATLGPVWGKTAVLAMTEFGRTARLNGTRGTDHGTGGAMLFAGGALRGGQVVADWPGLAEAALYQRRDLMPTRDIRAHAAWVMRDLFGVSVSDLERSVFPGLEMGDRSGMLI